MSFMKKTFGFMAVLSAIPASYALTARPSVIGTASSRMPTMTAYIGTSGTTITTGGGTTSSLLANSECIDAYTACMRGADACGPEFEECTTRVLFHGKMPMCLSTLAQCSSAGVTSLFGTGTTTALSAVASKNSYGEVTDYTYPTDGSVLGQLITGAAISNRYDTSTCVKRYTSCLKKDSVCGNDFELCTTDKEFRKQRVFCDSTLARCQSEGVIQLFGSANSSGTPSATSRVGELISEGAALAAVNAVSTCYKVVDQCILNACATNPYKCVENSTQSMVNLVELINSGTVTDASAAATTVSGLASGMDTITRSNISSYIKNACLDTIGSNKYCYATFLGNGQMPTASQLKDEDNQEEVYDEAYSARMNAAMRAKISDLVDKFDTKAKENCTQTIKSCVMRVCGSGSGAACYQQVFSGKEKTINKKSMHESLKTGCAAVVNTDGYCKYAAANPNTTGAYSYTYVNNDAFDILFPIYGETTNDDPIGVVAALNASLATSYSDAAIAQMKKQCQAVATSCVRSMCGADYQYCYRNRTDVYSDLTKTGNELYDSSMNKVGGVLDYTIVLGLCLNTVKNASVCEEHLAIEQNKISMKELNKDTASWGTGSVRGDWIDAGAATKVDGDNRVAAEDENGQPLCTPKGGTEQAPCYSVDTSGRVYDQPVYVEYTTYVQTQAASSLFKDLIYDLEKEAQAKYQAKLTAEQNRCLAANNGGVMGRNENGSTFQWVKLRSQKVPNSYATKGLTSNQFVISNDLYGSFCRVRITLRSDDKTIQDTISNGASWSTAYFAVGDPFTCGSWIPNTELRKMAAAVGQQAREDTKARQLDIDGWMTALGVLGGGVGMGFATDHMQDKGFLGGLLGTQSAKNSQEAASECVSNGEKYIKAGGDITSQYRLAAKMLSSARKIDTSKSDDADGRDAGDLDAAITKLSVELEKKDYINDAGVGGRGKGTKYTCMAKKCTSDNCSNSFPGGNYRSTAAYEKTLFKQGTGKNETHMLSIYCTGKIEEDEVEGIFDINHPENISDGDVKEITTTIKKSDVDTTNVTAAVNSLMLRCGEWETPSNKENRNRAITNGVGAVVGAVGGGILMNRLTRDIQGYKLDTAEQNAIQEFMSVIGDHIFCCIGDNCEAQYGGTYNTSMDDM